MTRHSPQITPDPKVERNDERLRHARGILADAAHHSDTEIKTAVDAILSLSRDRGDIARANQWAAILALDP